MVASAQLDSALRVGAGAAAVAVAVGVATAGVAATGGPDATGGAAWAVRWACCAWTCWACAASSFSTFACNAAFCFSSASSLRASCSVVIVEGVDDADCAWASPGPKAMTQAKPDAARARLRIVRE